LSTTIKPPLQILHYLSKSSTKNSKNLNFETRTSIISENLGVLKEICEKESKGCGMDLTSEGKRTRSHGREQERETKGDSKGCCSDCLNNKEKINLSC